MPASELSIRFPPTNSPLSCQHSSPLEQYQSRCGLIIYHPITAYRGRPDPTTNRNIYSTAPKTTVSTVHWRCLEFTSLLRSSRNKNNPQRHCHPSIDRSINAINNNNNNLCRVHENKFNRESLALVGQKKAPTHIPRYRHCITTTLFPPLLLS